jgi:hypothetical protein
MSDLMNPKKSPLDPEQLMIDPSGLDQAVEDKRQNSVMGGIADNIANRQSFGNFFLGKMQPKVDASEPFKADSEAIDQRLAGKKVLQDQMGKLPELKYQQAAMDKDSDISKTSAELHRAHLMSAANYLGKDNPELKKQFEGMANRLAGLSAYDQAQLMDKSGMSKILGSEGVAGMKLAAELPFKMLAAQRAGEGLDLKKNNQASQVANTFDNDSLIKQYTSQLGQIGKARSLLGTDGPIPHQIASELAQDLGTILNNGRAAGLEQANKQEYHSAQGMLANLQQFVTAHPQDALPPDFRKLLVDQFDRLEGATHQQRSLRSQLLSKGRSFQGNPAAQSAMEAKLQEYGDNRTDGSPLPGANAAGGANKAQAALAEAKSVLANPKSSPQDLQKAMKVWEKYRNEQGAQ